MSATEPKREGLRGITEIIGDLSKEIPGRLLKTKKMGGSEITFITWYTAVRFLDLYAPGWSTTEPKVTDASGVLVVTVGISILCKEGVVTRYATGQEEADVKGYGDSSSNAEAMALKRAAAKFGLGLYLYDGKH